MISKIFVFIGALAVVQGTFFCPPFELISFFNCDDNCSGISRPCGSSFSCTCILGFKRNSLGKCVPQKECCTGENEEYCESCSDKTCEDILRTVILRPPNKGKCCCRKGTVRSSDGRCISQEKCYPKCTGANEIFKRNGCDSKCNLRGVDSSECITRSNGCYCRDGFVRQNENDRNCIPRSECRCMGQNECYKIDGGCEKDCEGNDCSKCPGRPGCYCDKGHVRNLKKNMCVLPKDCKKACVDRHMLIDMAAKKR